MEKIVSRRTFLLGSTAFVAGCAGQTSNVAGLAATVVSDFQLIASGLNAALPGLAATGLVSAGALNTVTTNLQKVSAIAAGIGSASTQAQGQSAVQSIETLLNGAVSAAAAVTQWPPLQAAQVLLPVLEVGVGLVVAAVPQAGPMTPSQARLVLRGAAARRQ